MEFIMCLVIPIILMLCLLFACKWTKFSIIPEGLQVPSPKRFELPKLKRNGYKWICTDE